VNHAVLANPVGHAAGKQLHQPIAQRERAQHLRRTTNGNLKIFYKDRQHGVANTHRKHADKPRHGQ
jgi:hypothetical protein